MTKKSGSNEDKPLLPHQELSPDTLLKGYTMTDNIVEQYKRRADATGITVSRGQYAIINGRMMNAATQLKLSDVYFKDRSTDKEKTLRWLDQVCYPKTKKFITLDSLIKRTEIDESERNLYTQYFPEGHKQDFPVRIVHGYHRIKSEKKEWLETYEEWRGVTLKGAVVSRTATLYSYLIPFTQPELVDRNGNIIGSNQLSNIEGGRDAATQIITVGIMPNNELSGRKAFFLPWDKTNFESLYSLRNGEPNDPINGHGLTLHKPGLMHSIGVPNADEYRDMGFDELWSKYSATDRTIRFNPEDFKKFGPGPGDKDKGGEQYR
jgi:hypothetical protein